MTRKFEGKSFFCDDVILTEYLANDENDYRIEMYFVGGINEEGEEDLESSCYCEISVYEVTPNNGKTISRLIEMFNGEYDEDVVMISAPDIRRVARFRNESSLADTYDEYEAIIKEIEKEELR